MASNDPHQSPDSTQSSRQGQGAMAAEGSLGSHRVRGRLLAPHEMSGLSSSDEDDVSGVKTMSATPGSSRWEPVSLQQFSEWQWYRGRIRDVRTYIQTEYKLGHSPRARNWMETASISSMKVPMYLALGGFDHSILYLPMEWNRLNKELLRLHVGLLSRFKASVDGNLEGKSHFMECWLPFCLQDTLLLQIVLSTSASFAYEVGCIPKPVSLQYRGAVYRRLQEHMANLTTVSDSLILALTQLQTDSWYWGCTEDLHTHRRGLRSLLVYRGGLQNLGLQGFLARAVLVNDIAMSVAHECTPNMFGMAGFEYVDDESNTIPLETLHNCPFVFNWPPFKTTVSIVLLQYATAEILDEMRELFNGVVALEGQGAAADTAALELMAKAADFCQRLDALPRHMPLHKALAKSPAPTDKSKANKDAQDSHDSIGETPTRSRARTGNDPLYATVRLTAIIYSRALMNRQPISEVCSAATLSEVWVQMWEMSLASWSGRLGIFLWVVVALNPGIHQLPFARFMRTMLVITLMSIGINNWSVVTGAAETIFKVQRWLKGPRVEGEDENDENAVFGGEEGVDKFGFAFKTWLPSNFVDLDGFDFNEAP
ncbi:hypothetical protein S7711_04764 [Stachybotrys chartarum IBT 7711]|uniref:Transcription factor domain-containing protein n=1 Tax=Stachybotrys chartarum (strain CBS 109288 / IBT 7711) TaxID=1280523 RepID=A0A084ASF1_STACB|nr:hypothetical protein S7711_04764 [Stachybotrys chartarum IBT 7711]KFA50041.1 hypothetical protein S40293_06824 [Stachybotrys chartarum IBT 40293]